ncbi:hypothetical protein FKM82_012769 [Ascaphus truei]
MGIPKKGGDVIQCEKAMQKSFTLLLPVRKDQKKNCLSTVQWLNAFILYKHYSLLFLQSPLWSCFTSKTSQWKKANYTGGFRDN